MSPHRYLRLHRLSMARKELRAAGDGTALVNSIALSHGFWHLGCFALDHRALFGEPPSVTLEQSRNQDGPGQA